MFSNRLFSTWDIRAASRGARVLALVVLILTTPDLLHAQSAGLRVAREVAVGTPLTASKGASLASGAECLFSAPVQGLSEFFRGTQILRREVLQGEPGGRPADGTVIRFYSDPLTFSGDFDGDNAQETVRAITQVAGAGGSDPCPDGPDGNGCTQGERIVQEPFLSADGDWSIPLDPGFERSPNLGSFAPNTYELRFTEGGSLVWHLFTSEYLAQFPVELWDIGPVLPGEQNDPSDDVRMALASFSDGGGECEFAYGEYSFNGGSPSDRLYGFYFADGITYEMFESAALQSGALSESLAQPITGREVACENGIAGDLFACSAVDLLSFLPLSELSSASAQLNDIWGWTDPVTGHEWALVGLASGTAFVDVTDPTNPFNAGILPMTDGARASSWRDIKIYEDHAFVVADNAGQHGMQVFDLAQLRGLSTPQTFAASTTYDRIASAHNVVINTETGFAYTVGNSGGGETCGAGYHVIDIRDPKNPQRAGCWGHEGTGRAGTGYTHDAQCVIYRGPDQAYFGREICFGSNETAVSIADMTDKTNPVAVASVRYPNMSYTHQGWLSEDHRYLYVDDELDELGGVIQKTRTLIWDVTELDDPVLVTEFFGPTGATDHNMYIRGDLVFQANYKSGLRILDISDAESPSEVAYFDTHPHSDTRGTTGAWSVYPYFASGTIVVSSISEGLFVLKLASDVSTGIEVETPQTFALHQNYPNPFNPTTSIIFDLPESAEVTLTIADASGRTVVNRALGLRGAGRHSETFSAVGLPSGMYLYTVQAGEFTQSRSMVLLK